MQCDKQTNLYIQFLCRIFAGINYLIFTIMVTMITTWEINILLAGIFLFLISVYEGWRVLKNSRTRKIIGMVACMYFEAFWVATMLFLLPQSLKYIIILLAVLFFEGIVIAMVYHKIRIFHK